MLSLRYSLSPEDFANYSVYVHLEAPGKSKGRWKILRPLVAVLILVFGINMYSSFMASGSFNFIQLIPFVVILGIIVFANTVSIKQNVRKAAFAFAANPENSAYFSMADYIFSETGVTISDDVRDTRLQWRAFVKKQETAAYIYLFVNSSSAYIIPKRMFRSEVQQEELKRLFGQYLSFEAEVGHLIN